MGGELTEEALPELKERVRSAADKILEYKKKEKEWEEKKNAVESRLAGIIKRIEEFSGGR